MYGCVFGSTSGFTRSEIGATRPTRPATAFSTPELRRRFDVEAANAGRQRGLHLGRGLADTREDGLRRIAASGDDPLELAAGDDVEAASRPRQQIQHREVGVRLHRVADEVRRTGEGSVEGAEALFERGARIDVARRAEALGDRRERHAFGVELAAASAGMRSRLALVAVANRTRQAAPAVTRASRPTAPMRARLASLQRVAAASAVLSRRTRRGGPRRAWRPRPMRRRRGGIGQWNRGTSRGIVTGNAAGGTAFPPARCVAILVTLRAARSSRRACGALRRDRERAFRQDSRTAANG